MDETALRRFIYELRLLRYPGRALELPTHSRDATYNAALLTHVRNSLTENQRCDAVADLEGLFELAQSTDQILAAFHIRSFQASLLLTLGRPARAIEHVGHCISLARQLPEPHFTELILDSTIYARELLNRHGQEIEDFDELSVAYLIQVARVCDESYPFDELLTDRGPLWDCVSQIEPKLRSYYDTDSKCYSERLRIPASIFLPVIGAIKAVRGGSADELERTDEQHQTAAAKSSIAIHRAGLLYHEGLGSGRSNYFEDALALLNQNPPFEHAARHRVAWFLLFRSIQRALRNRAEVGRATTELTKIAHARGGRLVIPTHFGMFVDPESHQQLIRTGLLAEPRGFPFELQTYGEEFFRELIRIPKPGRVSVFTGCSTSDGEYWVEYWHDQLHGGVETGSFTKKDLKSLNVERFVLLIDERPPQFETSGIHARHACGARKLSWARTTDCPKPLDQQERHFLGALLTAYREGTGSLPLDKLRPLLWEDKPDHWEKLVTQIKWSVSSKLAGLLRKTVRFNGQQDNPHYKINAIVPYCWIRAGQGSSRLLRMGSP